MKWKIRISEVGREVKELIETAKQFDLVIEGKRNDMRDFTVHFDGGFPVEPLKEGDEFTIGGTSMYIIALGEQVNEHIKAMERVPLIFPALWRQAGRALSCWTACMRTLISFGTGR